MEDVEDEKSFNDANAAPLADHHGTESMATPDIYYTLDPARKLLSGNLFEMLKGHVRKERTPEKLVQDLRESRIDPLGPERCRPQ